MKVGFTGTRQGLTKHQYWVLDGMLSALCTIEGSELHIGDCVGADTECRKLAKKYGIRAVGHPPKDPKHRAMLEYDEIRPVLPYIERNHVIVDETDWLLAYPRTMKEELRSGTWATIRYALANIRRVAIVLPDGRIQDDQVFQPAERRSRRAP